MGFYKTSFAYFPYQCLNSGAKGRLFSSSKAIQTSSGNNNNNNNAVPELPSEADVVIIGNNYIIRAVVVS